MGNGNKERPSVIVSSLLVSLFFFLSIIMFVHVLTIPLQPPMEQEFKNQLHIRVKEVKDSNLQARVNVNFTIQQINNSKQNIKCIINNDIIQKNIFNQILKKEQNKHHLILNITRQRQNGKTLITTYSNNQDYYLTLSGSKQLFPYDSYLLNTTILLPNAIIHQNETKTIYYTWPGEWGHSKYQTQIHPRSDKTQISSYLIIDRVDEISGYIDFIFTLILLLNFLVYIALYDEPPENYSTYITLVFALTGLYITGLPSFPVKSIFNIIKYRTMGMAYTILIPFYTKIVRKNAKDENQVVSNSWLFRSNFWYYWIFYTLFFIAPNIEKTWLTWSSIMGPDIVYLIILIVMIKVTSKREKDSLNSNSTPL